MPSDHETSGLITDDTLFERLVRPLPAGCRLTCLFDCCHSGTPTDVDTHDYAGRPVMHLGAASDAQLGTDSGDGGVMTQGV